jgi:hypothetical protein
MTQTVSSRRTASLVTCVGGRRGDPTERTNLPRAALRAERLWAGSGEGAAVADAGVVPRLALWLADVAVEGAFAARVRDADSTLRDSTLEQGPAPLGAR